jgi:hypothetical protein
MIRTEILQPLDDPRPVEAERVALMPLDDSASRVVSLSA